MWLLTLQINWRNVSDYHYIRQIAGYFVAASAESVDKHTNWNVEMGNSAISSTYLLVFWIIPTLDLLSKGLASDTSDAVPWDVLWN